MWEISAAATQNVNGISSWLRHNSVSDIRGWPVVLRYTYAYFITSLSLLWPRYLAGWLAVSIAAQVTYLIQVLYTIVLADATAESKGGIHSSLVIINFFFSSEYVCYVVARNKTILLHFPMCV